MISVAEARAALLKLVDATDAENVPLAHAGGRWLAAPVAATRTQPPFAASAMDGYAVRASDAVPGKTLDVIGEAAAGTRFEGSVDSGQAVRIFTGAPVPDGADKILIQEDCTRDGETIIVSDNIDAAGYIRPAGGDFHAGDEIAPEGPLNANQISLMAAMNLPALPLRRKPEFALLATGDELVAPGDEPGPDQIVSSNNFGLKAMIDAAGGHGRILPIARDNPASLKTALDMAVDADCIVTLGGASVGDHDLMGQMAKDGTLETDFYKVAMRPGKPMMAGRYQGTPLVGLPGNPVSALVCGHVFLRPMILKMLGASTTALPELTATLAAPLRENGPRAHYMRATVDTSNGAPVITAAIRQDSSLLSVAASANALLIRPPHDPARNTGDTVAYLPF